MICKKEIGSFQSQTVYEYTLENAGGTTMTLYTFGGVIQSLLIKDQNGVRRDVVLGYPSLNDYIDHPCYYGALIGRYANRIGGGKFSMDGKEYHLTVNENGNTLHGGEGFGRRVWQPVEESEKDGASVTLRLESPDGEDGFPGNVTMDVTYTLTDDNCLRIEYRGTSDGKTPINMTNHSYFNLSGEGEMATDHILWVDADAFTEAGGDLLPTGRLLPVKDTPFDFTSPKAVGKEIGSDYPAVKSVDGYDLNFVINGWDGSMKRVASLSSPKTGLYMEVYTDKPGVQFYTDNADDPVPGKCGKPYPRHGAVCLETQFFPDTPNHPEFPGGFIAPGEMYHFTTEYRFHL